MNAIRDFVAWLRGRFTRRRLFNGTIDGFRFEAGKWADDDIARMRDWSTKARRAAQIRAAFEEQRIRFVDFAERGDTTVTWWEGFHGVNDIVSFNDVQMTDD